MKTILFEKTKRIVLDYSNDAQKMEAKKEGFKKLETMQVDDKKALFISIMLNDKAILKIDFEGNVKETKIHKDYVIYHTWQAILDANTDYIIPPFTTANDYNRQTYQMKIMCQYGFKFERAGNLNIFKYEGKIHGNKTLLQAKYSNYEL